MKHLLFIFLLFTGLSAYAQNIIAPAVIDTNTVWNCDTVFLDQDMEIFQSFTLSILPGTVIMSRGQNAIFVQGTLVAFGNATDSITFTANDTTNFSDTSVVEGGWKGIYFLNTSSTMDSSLFDFCVLEYGKACGSSDQEKSGGVLYVYHFDKIRISNSAIRNNLALDSGGGIYMDYCSANIYHNFFSHNQSFLGGGAIYMGYGSYGKIFNNLFKYNTVFHLSSSGGSLFMGGQGAAIYLSDEPMGQATTEVFNNRCFNNKCVHGVIYESTRYTTIANNLICNNSGSGIMNGHSLSESKYINNTIAHNEVFGNYSAIDINSTRVAVINNIVWNNYNEAYYPLDTQCISGNWMNPDSVQYNLIMDNNFPDNGNMSMQDPLFVDPSPGIGLAYDGELYNWALMDNSPVINAGKENTIEMYPIPLTDIKGEDRVFGGCIDMGAIENQNVLGIDNPQAETSGLICFPNPAKQQITLDGIAPSIQQISIFDQQGRLVLKIETYKGESKCMIDVSSLRNGVYSISVGQSSAKLVILH
ncbi:MAG: T9SS type A sorting domain-containing protein [Bacteroidales bacterium]|nr:T9SS type A sorting domain-containing protein [Bacteroidales bacterium]MCF8456821.1 T9SS type A sorting domain-containing protein [Bacteroidales bacterium]